MPSQGNHHINEESLQNSQHFALCWQGYSLEKLWLLSCCGRGEMRREDGRGVYGLMRDSRKGERTQVKWETVRKCTSLKAQKVGLRGDYRQFCGDQKEEYMTGERC